jgi:hypothetical protein
MATIFVAQSKGLQQWAADVGLTRHVFLVGVEDEAPAAIAERLNAARRAGRGDWKLVAVEPAEALDEASAFRRLGRKESLVDPSYYPQIKGSAGIVKVKLTNVENAMMVERALANLETKAVKVTPQAIAAYLIKTAKG